MPKFRRQDRDDDGSEEWLGGRRGTAIAAFAFLVLVGISGIVVVATGGSDTSGEPAHPSAGPPQSGIVPAPAAVGGSPADDAWDGTTSPPGVSWSVVSGVVLPSSPTAGPEHISGAASDIATGYARNRVGALLAAVQISTRYFLAGDSDWKAAALAMLAPGPGRDAWIRVRGSLPPQSGSEAPGSLRQLAGFQFVSYSAAEAVIQFADRSPLDGALQVVPIHVAWLDGDWKLVPAPDGGNAASAQQVDSLSGFVAWGGMR